MALWISGCREKNITLDTNIICSKAKKLYETFADSEEQDDAEPRPLNELGSKQNQAHLMTARAGLRNLRNTLGLKVFHCMERPPLQIPLEQKQQQI